MEAGRLQAGAAKQDGEEVASSVPGRGRVPQRSKTEAGRKQVAPRLMPFRSPSAETVTDAGEKDNDTEKEREREHLKPKKKKRSLKKMVMGDRQTPALRREYIAVKSEAGATATVTLSKGVRVTGEELTAFAVAALGLEAGLAHTLHCRWTGERAAERPELVEVAGQEAVEDLLAYSKADGSLLSEFVVRAPAMPPLRTLLPQPGNRRAAPVRSKSPRQLAKPVTVRPRVRSTNGPRPGGLGGPVLSGRGVDALDLGSAPFTKAKKSNSPPWSPVSSPVSSPRDRSSCPNSPRKHDKLLKKLPSEKEKEKKEKKLEKEREKREKEREKEREREEREREKREKDRRDKERKEKKLKDKNRRERKEKKEKLKEKKWSKGISDESEEDVMLLEAAQQIVHPLHHRLPSKELPQASQGAAKEPLKAAEAATVPVEAPAKPKALLDTKLRSTLVRTQSDTVVRGPGGETPPMGNAIAAFRAKKFVQPGPKVGRAPTSRLTRSTDLRSLLAGPGKPARRPAPSRLREQRGGVAKVVVRPGARFDADLVARQRQREREDEGWGEVRARRRSKSEPFFNSWDYHVVSGWVVTGDATPAERESSLSSALEKNTISIPSFGRSGTHSRLKKISEELHMAPKPWPRGIWMELPPPEHDKLGSPPQIWIVKGHLFFLVEFVANLKCHREFREAFLLTMRYHTEPEEVFSVLAGRVMYLHEKHLASQGSQESSKAPPQPGSRYDKYLVGIKQAISLIDAWTRHPLLHFYDSKSLCAQLRQLIEFLENEVYNGTALTQRLMVKEPDQQVMMFSMTKAPAPFMPPARYLAIDGHTRISFLDLHPVEVARQITLSDFDYVASLRESDLYNGNWQGPKGAERAPQMVAYTQWFNHVTYWAVTEILTALNEAQRRELIERYVAVLQALFEMRNYNGTMAILSALNMGVVSRLRNTWAGISKKSRKALDAVAETMDSHKNFANYRELLRNSLRPYLPFQALICGDIVKAASSMDSRYADGAINFRKMIELAKLLEEVTEAQQVPYCFYRVPAIELYLRTAKPVTDEDELYRLSYDIEAFTGG